MLILFLMFLSSPVGDATQKNDISCPSVIKFISSLVIKDKHIQTACSVEIQLRDAGWNDAMVIGALANAWHESRWDASEVGDRGNSVGFWQLNKNGLGKDMGNLRYNYRISTEKIIESVKRQKIRETNAEEAAKTFCRMVMRPSNSFQKSLARAQTAQLAK